MKVAVTTIMLNEPHEFIERWAASCVDADYRVLIDTGSTNGAVEFARGLGITVHEITVRPWRFDVARNAGLALIPADVDIVVTLDVDEILMPGWRLELDKAFYTTANQYTYHYQWSPEIAFIANRIHSRYGWIWRHPCHETLYATGDVVTTKTNIAMVHLPDNNKSRGGYLELLALAVEEDPTNDRMAHYYARELYFQGHWPEARAQFVRHLELPTARWGPERSQSYRYLAKMDDYPMRWILHAIAEAPERREPYVDAMLWHKAQGNQAIALGYASQALLIQQNSLDYMTESNVWDDDWVLSQVV